MTDARAQARRRVSALSERLGVISRNCIVSSVGELEETEAVTKGIAQRG